MHGLLITLELVAISGVIGALLAIPIAAARLSKNRVISAIAFGYVYFFRGTPLLAQLFLIYYGLGEFAVQYMPQLKAMGLWVYLARRVQLRDLRLLAEHRRLPGGDPPRRNPIGAARAMGGGARSWPASPAATVEGGAPQAAMVALRPLGNEIILLIKASAIASIVTVLDLMGETRLAFSRSYDLSVYLYAAIIYLVLVEGIRRMWNAMDRRLTRHLRREFEAITDRGCRPRPGRRVDFPTNDQDGEENGQGRLHRARGDGIPDGEASREERRTRA